MTYYYAVNGQQTGPVSEEQLRGMVASGAIPADTLVWREGMPQWLPFSTALPTAAAAGSAVAGSSVAVAESVPQGTVECTVCHQAFPADQTIRYGTVNVCAGCKPKFMQGLREGATPVATLAFAGGLARVVAKIVDMVVMWVFQWILNLTVLSGFNQALQGGAAGNPPNMGAVMTAMAAIWFFSFAIYFAYQILFLHWRGQTPGKMLLKVKVVNPDGTPLSWGKSIGRPAAEILSGCTLWIGYIIAFFDDEKRTLHDRLAGTRVVKVNA